MIRLIAAVGLLAACAGNDDGGGMVVPMPDVCEPSDDCQLSRSFASARCQIRYMCDPTYTDDMTTCVADELAKLCESGDAAVACSLNGCRRQFEIPPCLNRPEMSTCSGDPVVCLMQPPDTNCAP